MNDDSREPPLLDADHAAFIARRVSILAASCSADRVPSLARAYGCRIAADRRSVTVFLVVAQAQALLQDLRSGGTIAVVFSRPSTHETLQLKGPVRSLEPVDDDDRRRMRAYGRSFGEEIGPLGFDAAFQQAVMAPVEHEAVAVTFVPAAAFVQTPGPMAGQPLATSR